MSGGITTKGFPNETRNRVCDNRRLRLRQLDLLSQPAPRPFWATMVRKLYFEKYIKYKYCCFGGLSCEKKKFAATTRQPTARSTDNVPDEKSTQSHQYSQSVQRMYDFFD